MAFASNAESELWLKKHMGQSVEVMTVGHGSKQHSTFFGYLDWVRKARYAAEYLDLDGFWEWVALNIGYTERRRHKVQDGHGGWVMVETFKARSRSHAKCPQETWKKVMNRSEDFLFQLTGLSIEMYVAHMAECDDEPDGPPPVAGKKYVLKKT